MTEANDSPESPTSTPPPIERQPARRRLPRFGLRTLLIFGLVFCLLFGLLGRNLVRIRREDAAIETLKQAGATVYVAHGDGWKHHPETPYVFYPNPDWSVVPSFTSRLIGWSGRAPVMQVDLASDKADSDQLRRALAALAVFQEIECVGLTGPEMTDETLQALNRLPNVETLELCETSITGEGLAGIPAPERFRNLSLFRQGPLAEVLEGAAALPALRHLQLVDMPVSRAEIARIASLPKLESLRLVAVRPTEAGAYSPLADAKNLDVLFVQSSSFDDEAAAAIANLPRLEIVYVGEISDTGLAKLDRLPRLRWLTLRAPVTQEAARAFAAAHPDAVIEYLPLRSIDGVTIYRGEEELDPAAGKELYRSLNAAREEVDEP